MGFYAPECAGCDRDDFNLTDRKIIEQRLERLRNKLLDLSTANRMLNFRHPKVSCLRIVDELPEQIFDLLMDGGAFTFEPVPEPTTRELEAFYAQRPDQGVRATASAQVSRPDVASWARHLGIEVRYDLPPETDNFERPERHSDKKIQTLHYPDELDPRLRKIRSAARTAIEESGANMLYLAFGFLEWRDPHSSKAYQAPLILLPVELDRETARGGQIRTRVRWTGEELQPNLSLHKKLEELNIELPLLEDEQALEAYLTKVARAVRQKSDWMVRRYVTLGLFEFGKILVYLDLNPDRWPAFAPVADNPLVKEILGGPDDPEAPDESREAWDGESPPSAEEAKARDLTLEVVDRADSSQCEALEIALSGRNLVVQGPPGTGKSQTITNLVAAALARGKTVLFVAEKLAALEVVRRRMRELGLGDFCLELHSHKTRKTEVLEDIASRIQAGARIRPPREYDGALTRLAERRQKLSAYIDIVGKAAAGFSNLTINDALMKAGQARRKLGGKVSAVEGLKEVFSPPDPLTWSAFIEAKNRLDHLADAIKTLDLDGSAFSHPWAGVSSAQVFPQDSSQIAQLAENWSDKIDALIEVSADPRLKPLSLFELATAPNGLKLLGSHREALISADRVAATMEGLLGIELRRTTEGARAMRAMIAGAATAPLTDLTLRSPALLGAGAIEILRNHKSQLEALKNGRSELTSVFREAAFRAQVDDLEEWSAALAQKGLFAKFGRRWRQALLGVNALLRPGSINDKSGAKSHHLSRLREHLLGLRSAQSNFAAGNLLGSNYASLNFDMDGYIRIAEWATKVRATVPDKYVGALLNATPENLASVTSYRLDGIESHLESLDAIGASDTTASFWAAGVEKFITTQLAPSALSGTKDEDWRRLVELVDLSAKAAQEAIGFEQKFIERTGLDIDRWFGAGGRPHHEGVSARARLAAAHVKQLAAWLEFDRAFKGAEVEFEYPIAIAAAEGAIATDTLQLTFDFLVFDAIARDAFATNPSLLKMSGKSLDNLREEYAALDSEVMELRRAHIAATLLTRRPPEGRSSGRKADLTEMALVRAELSKQKRHVPIRQLVNRAGRALQAIKPCFMMGPLSVAQYIAPGTLKFDLVIMDEASQMRPEDAIGALARGGQAVIVGDTKQLPPTSFFERIADTMADADDEELTLAEDSKSILELSEKLFTSRMLKWHYRSRHESLIAFSNRNFYKSNLIVFPSPSGQGERLGIGWHFLDQGVTTSGVNPVEAHAVARAAAHALLNDRRRTVGVVAMNVKQAQRISDELAALAKDDAALAKILNDAENSTRGEPFFVKNLENVQGDERDVIIISMTYGPKTPGGPTPQNFGPINRETGWRRLNVLFTRAKERMEVFSSMTARDVVLKEGEDSSPRALKLFLDYAETGRLGEEPRPSGRDPENDFEDAIIEGLQELNFETVPQVGVANFFLDIGVRDPNAPHEFIAAVECDGASYHSSPSARDRDRLRQEILENLGWNIIRIWSTDWFRDPTGELARVSNELRHLIAAKAEERSQSPARPIVKVEAQTTPTQGPLKRPPIAVAPRRVANGLSIDQARAELIDLRENKIKLSFPDADLARGILRKSMLDELIRKRPKDHSEFLGKISLELRQNTDADQLRKFGEDIFEILDQIE
jgi:very-short-patch-repair endonuclease